MAGVTLSKVKLQTDVYMVCLQHALSTEKFEVMGLLIGDVCLLVYLLFYITFYICEKIRIASLMIYIRQYVMLQTSYQSLF